MVKVVWAERAIDDLTNIAKYSSNYSEKYASSIVSKLFNKVNILKTMPKIGRMVPEKNDENIRELIEGNYRIIYEIRSEDRIEVLLVHHSSRPLGNIWMKTTANKEQAPRLVNEQKETSMHTSKLNETRTENAPKPPRRLL